MAPPSAGDFARWRKAATRAAAMARDIERLTGVPIVCITYDGTGQYRNDVIVPYLRYAARESVATG